MNSNKLIWKIFFIACLMMACESENTAPEIGPHTCRSTSSSCVIPEYYKKLPLIASDSIAVNFKDSVGLKVFDNYAYNADSNTLKVNRTLDTLTFTYASYYDNIRKSKGISGLNFSLIKSADGKNIIYGEIYPYFSDALEISDSLRYSLNLKCVLNKALEKGNYKVVIKSNISCFCIPTKNKFSSAEFTVE